MGISSETQQYRCSEVALLNTYISRRNLIGLGVIRARLIREPLQDNALVQGTFQWLEFWLAWSAVETGECKQPDGNGGGGYNIQSRLSIECDKPPAGRCDTSYELGAR